MVGANDLAKAKAFYDATMGAIGHPAGSLEGFRVFYRTPTGMFSVTTPINGEPATKANGGTIGFTCNSPEDLMAWHAAGVASGGTTCEDPPGQRASGTYLAYLRDPDGNKLCAVYRPPK
jgi:catechol 2,3-dioxygenase-like lactoylglutathione lyase family enzyme